MNRQLIVGIGALSITQQTRAPIQLSRSLSSRTDAHNRNGSGNVDSVRKWLASFSDNPEIIPSSVQIEEVKFGNRNHRRSAQSNQSRRTLVSQRCYILDHAQSTLVVPP